MIVFKTNNLQHEDCSSLSFKKIFKPRSWQNFGDQVLQIWKSSKFPASPNVMEVCNVQVIRAERTVKESEAMTRTDTGEDSLHKEQQLQKKQKQ